MTDNQDSHQDKPCKAFRLAANQIRDLARGHGACMASDRITVDGAKVGFCYREASDFVADSGWRFFAGDESQAYTDCAENFASLADGELNKARALLQFLKRAPRREHPGFRGWELNPYGHVAIVPRRGNRNRDRSAKRRAILVFAGDPRA
jgi:hypothetical protein